MKHLKPWQASERDWIVAILTCRKRTLAQLTAETGWSLPTMRSKVKRYKLERMLA